MDKALALPPMELGAYEITDIARVMTPALAIYPEIVDANIDVTLAQMAGDTNRWRPHVKTSKLGFIMRRLVERGVHQFKCSTSLELLTIIEAGAKDVLLAYPSVGANAARVVQIAEQHRALPVGRPVHLGVEIPAEADRDLAGARPDRGLYRRILKVAVDPHEVRRPARAQRELADG